MNSSYLGLLIGFGIIVILNSFFYYFAGLRIRRLAIIASKYGLKIVNSKNGFFGTDCLIAGDYYGKKISIRDRYNNYYNNETSTIIEIDGKQIFPSGIFTTANFLSTEKIEKFLESLLTKSPQEIVGVYNRIYIIKLLIFIILACVFSFFMYQLFMNTIG